MKHLILALAAAAALVAASPSPSSSSFASALPNPNFKLDRATSEPLHASKGFDISIQTDTSSANGDFHCRFVDPVWVCARK